MTYLLKSKQIIRGMKDRLLAAGLTGNANFTRHTDQMTHAAKMADLETIRARVMANRKPDWSDVINNRLPAYE